MNKLLPLLRNIRECQLCADHLPLNPKPILQAHNSSRLLIVGQAPGIRVHNTGIPWNDPSGDRLRHWMQLDKKTFYDITSKKFLIFIKQNSCPIINTISLYALTYGKIIKIVVLIGVLSHYLII